MKAALLAKHTSSLQMESRKKWGISSCGGGGSRVSSCYASIYFLLVGWRGSFISYLLSQPLHWASQQIKRTGQLGAAVTMRWKINLKIFLAVAVALTLAERGGWWERWRCMHSLCCECKAKKALKTYAAKVKIVQRQNQPHLQKGKCWALGLFFIHLCRKYSLRKHWKRILGQKGTMPLWEHNLKGAFRQCSSCCICLEGHRSAIRHICDDLRASSTGSDAGLLAGFAPTSIGAWGGWQGDGGGVFGVRRNEADWAWEGLGIHAQ